MIPGSRTSPRPIVTTLGVALAVGVLVLLVFSGFGTNRASAPAAPSFSAPSHSLPPAPLRTASAPAAAQPATPAPSDNGSFNPNCAKITATVCVAIAASDEPNIVPVAGYFASVEPSPKADLTLIIKSRYLLNQSNAIKNGPDSPIALNVTGTLWNGDLYAGFNSSTVWHANNGSWWNGPVNHSGQDKSYGWWYTVTISWSNNGVANVFAGETMTWWIEITNQTGNVFTHIESPKFQYTYEWAWPFSPYAGSQQYAGPNATFADVNVLVHPAQPNWNDSVRVVVNTTAANLAPVNATLGSALLKFNETYNGATIARTIFRLPVNVSGTIGSTSSSFVIPASYAQLAGATVTYQLFVTDVPGDQLVTPVYTYTVGGNGTWTSGTFTDDLGVTSSPNSVATAAGAAVTLPPGTSVNVTITSLNAGTAVNAAELVEYFSYPAINEKVVANIPMHRLSSTIYQGTLPGVPIGSFVNFTIDAWDFDQHQLVSPQFSYVTPSFTQYVPFVPGNASFFYVYVYDNGTHQWAPNVTVIVTGPAGFYHSIANTTYGVAYPNASQEPQVPLLLAANESYSIVVVDPTFVPTVGGIPRVIEANVTAYHSMTARQTLVAAANYVVVQEGSSILFYLNATPPPPAPSPSAQPSGIPVAALVGLVATLGTAIPLYLWWRQIRARRKEEEKRVTL
ncbi:MAG: hypothetical protein L3K18_09440 [Thermoplasmata archaeon]|nr:hypothetical protein [Thermoplasmata archaeon]